MDVYTVATDVIRSQLLFLTSRNRDTGSPASCQFNLPNPLVVCQENEEMQLEVLDFYTYRGFSNIASGYNNSFTVDSVGAGQARTSTFTIPAGQYSAQTLLYALNNLLVFNAYPIVTGKNDTFGITQFFSNGSQRSLTITLAPGMSSPATIASQIQTQCNAGLTNAYTVTYSSSAGFSSGQYTIQTADDTYQFNLDFSGANSAYYILGAQQTTYGTGSTHFKNSVPWQSVVAPCVNGVTMTVTYDNNNNVFNYSLPGGMQSVNIRFDSAALNTPATGPLLGFPNGGQSGVQTTTFPSAKAINVNAYDSIYLLSNLTPHAANLTVDNHSPSFLVGSGSIQQSLASGSQASDQQSLVRRQPKQSHIVARIPMLIPMNTALYWQPTSTFPIRITNRSINHLHLRFQDEFGNPMPLDDWTATIRVGFVAPKEDESNRVVSVLSQIKDSMQFAAAYFAKKR